MFPTNNSYYSSTSYPHSSSHCRRPGRSTGGGRNPPKRDGGSSGLPELTPHPWDPVRVPATETSTPLPPAPTEPTPPCIVPPGLDLHPPYPCQEYHKPPRRPTLPLPPTVTTTPPTSAVSKPRGTHLRRPHSPRRCRPHRPGRGGGGRGSEHSALSLPGLCSRSVGYYLRMVIPILVGGVCNIDQLPVGEVGKKVPTGLPPLLSGGIGQKWREGSGVVVVLCSVCW